LRATFSDRPEAVEEYIDEGENQDGEEYWEMFDSLRSLEEDFREYLDNIDDR
jgi:hypothetical protein